MNKEIFSNNPHDWETIHEYKSYKCCVCGAIGITDNIYYALVKYYQPNMMRYKYTFYIGSKLNANDIDCNSVLMDKALY